MRSFNGLIALISLEMCDEITMLSISKTSSLHHTIILGKARTQQASTGETQ